MRKFLPIPLKEMGWSCGRREVDSFIPALAPEVQITLALTISLHHPQKDGAGWDTLPCNFHHMQSQLCNCLYLAASVVRFLEKKKNSVRIFNQLECYSRPRPHPQGSCSQKNDLQSVIWMGVTSGWSHTRAQTPRQLC